MQSEVMDKILQTGSTLKYWSITAHTQVKLNSIADKSIVVSAPTSSGKTVILELAIVRLLTKLDETECKAEFKIIYSEFEMRFTDQ